MASHDPLPILYRDELLVAVCKPSGLLVHRSPVDRRERRFALQLVRDAIGQRVFPVHRLDKPTSGVLVFALDTETAALLGAAFAEGRVNKSYWAVVRGHAPPAGTIDHAFRPKADPLAGIGTDHPPLPAVTDYRRIATVEWPLPVDRYPSARYSLLEVNPRTGRRHQIRRHLKHIAHPIVGDTTYGKTPHNRLFAERFDCQRLLLHALTLTFAHPADGRTLRIRAPLDDVFRQVLREAGWPDPAS